MSIWALIMLIIGVVFSIFVLVYLIKSIIDMWKDYSVNKNESALLFFIISIVGFFLSGSLISFIVAIIFYWSRSRKMAWYGILLLLLGVIVGIASVFVAIAVLSDSIEQVVNSIINQVPEGSVQDWMSTTSTDVQNWFDTISKDLPDMNL